MRPTAISEVFIKYAVKIRNSFIIESIRLRITIHSCSILWNKLAFRSIDFNYFFSIWSVSSRREIQWCGNWSSIIFYKTNYSYLKNNLWKDVFTLLGNRVPPIHKGQVMWSKNPVSCSIYLRRPRCKLWSVN